ncbi:CidA/LrgA family protein [Pseudobacillus badius]|uniref:CidA/LrgA family protein n=1 Tax=Bacillus badius TaxID=1455 RepID=UPI0007B0581D|nr:CidA/LrgA family holin-like protein [Bacillus badius]KZN98349.1 holin [Bacillus badius]MED0666835.1 CidA/LrgA family holin-like protein [Bacillus badius]OCS82718.1 holin [Bacillus badius]OVE51424.1 holin [Bacillus badius]TDW02531.1 holin-like protein [Bacillus badius]
MRIFLGSTVQVMLLCAFSLSMRQLVNVLHLKVPGSILGMFILFILLQTKVIRLEWIELGANWLLAELLLFFIPSAVGIIKYKEMLIDDGIYITVVIILSTAVVMACTGMTAKKIAERKGQRPSS